MYKNWLKSYQNIREVLIPKPLIVRKGGVPKSLKGSYYKSSPGQFDKFGSQVAHPFDGDGYVSSFYIDNGQIYYQARFVDTQHRIHEEFLKNRLYTGAFGTPPHGTFIKNPANTTVIQWGKYLIVFCESGAPYLLDPFTLKTIGTLIPFRDGLPFRFGIAPLDHTLHEIGIFGDAVGAHPKIVGDRLVLYSIVFENTHTRMTFFELSKDYEIVSSTEYLVQSPLYFVHDFQVTENEYLFVEHSVQLNMKHMSRGLVNCIEPHPEKHFNRIHRVPRNKTLQRVQITKEHCKEILPGFITHYAGSPVFTSNQYEFWCILYPKPIEWDHMENLYQGALYKSIWNIKENSIYQQRITDYFYEFPVEGEITHHGSYIYTLMSHPDKIKTSSVLAKLNRSQCNPDKMIEDVWYSSEELFLGEPMYAQGFVLTVCYDSEHNESLLYIFDCKKISKGPVCILELPYPSPIGLHGFWSSMQPILL
jgi:all-trans-8'-apo-beta-carotenal 15,15'-oxygenase